MEIDSVLTNSEIWSQNSQLLYPVVMAMGAILLAVISSYATYRFTRNMQLEAEWRKDKLKHYGQLLDSVTNITSVPDDLDNAFKQYAKAYNVVGLIAPQEVANILYDVYSSNRIYLKQLGNKDKEKVERAKTGVLMKQLVLAMRKDLRIKPGDDPDSFRYTIQPPLIFEE